MESHYYNLTRREWARLLVPPVVAFICLAAVAKLMINVVSGPDPRAVATTLDDVIMAEKSRLSTAPSAASALFIGDSSCMMDLDFGEMRRLCPTLRGCNLGSLSTLGLPQFTSLLQSYLEAQGIRDGVQLANAPGVAGNAATRAVYASTEIRNAHPKLIILLLSPEMVRSAHQPIVHTRNQEQERKRRELLAQKQTRTPKFDLSGWLSKFYDLTAVSRLRSEVVDPLIEHPLPNRWGETYGSLAGVRSYLSIHDGCAIDPSERGQGPVAPPLKSAELAPLFLSQCRDFAKRVPASMELAVGLTPIPESEAEPGYTNVIHAVLLQLKDALNAGTALTKLPATLPDHYFSTSTHLNHDGALEYSHHVCRALRQAELISGPSQPAAARRHE